ncbi:MAG: 4Fe-4S binding protein [Dehalococcoidia bacterium]|jgi:NADH-quinone oxidoreductase subunit I
MLGVLRGMVETFRTMVRRPVTIQYPTVRREIPVRERGYPLLLWDDEVGEPFCVGCHACERACPTECISVIMKDNPLAAEGKSKRRKIVDKFLLDYGRCIRCRICVEVCNFSAIAMNNGWDGHELSRYDRGELVMDLESLLATSKAHQIEPWVAP